MSDKVKVTFVVPSNLQQELRQYVINDGYGLRGKSRWVTEAIERFLKLENYEDLVNLGDEMKRLEKVETITMEKSLKKSLNQAIHEVRVKHPLLEGVQSVIIRTSIVHRLLRS